MSEGGPSFSEQDLQQFFQDVENHANQRGEREAGAPPRYLEIPPLTGDIQTQLAENMHSYGVNRTRVLERLGDIVDTKGEKSLPFSGLQEYLQAEKQDLQAFAKLFEKNVPKEWKEAREIADTARQGVIEQARNGAPKPVNVYVIGSGDNKTYTLDATKGTLYFTFSNPDHWVGINAALHPMETYLNAHEHETKVIGTVAAKMKQGGRNLRSLPDFDRSMTMSYLHEQRVRWQPDDTNYKIFDTFYNQVEAVWTNDEIALARGKKLARHRDTDTPNPRMRIQHVKR